MSSKGFQSQHVPYIQKFFSWSNCLWKASALTQKPAVSQPSWEQVSRELNITEESCLDEFWYLLTQWTALLRVFSELRVSRVRWESSGNEMEGGKEQMPPCLQALTGCEEQSLKPRDGFCFFLTKANPPDSVLIPCSFLAGISTPRNDNRDTHLDICACC